MSKNIGFLSFRFAGTDGVTLETLKWEASLRKLGYNCFYCAGEIGMPKEISMEFPEMHFNHERVLEVTQKCFSRQDRPFALSSEIHHLRKTIKRQIYDFIRKFNIDVLIPQNILAMPMNISLSMAMVEVIAETRIPTIAHHHDFYWERERFSINCVQDILKGCFPASLPNIAHVVINKEAQSQLAFRYGLSSTIVPNVMDYSHRPIGKDKYNSDIRTALGLDDDSLFILQPTRIVQRKGIEHTIEIAKRMERKTTIVISHESGDEGGEYKERVLEFAHMLSVDVRMTAEVIGEARVEKDGKKIYDLNDAYAYADIITYPSIIEGFGNALLETYYFKKPVVINTYPVYVSDIKPKGFKGIEFSNFVSRETIKDIHSLLSDETRIQDMVDTNYTLANQYFSYELLEKRLSTVCREFFGV